MGCIWKYKIVLTFISSLFFCSNVSAISSPTNLRVVDLQSNSVTVAWTPPVDAVDTFSISISPLNDGESALPQFFNSSHATWNNLVPGKSYTIEVRSIVEGEEPSLPAILILTTVPASPYNIKISKFVNPLINQYRITGSKTMMYPVYGAVVSWQQPDIGIFDDFVLTVDPAHGSVRVPIKLKSGLPSEQRTEERRIVWDLIPGVEYGFTVQAKSNGVLSNPITGRERMPPEIPGAIKVESLKPTSVVISWEGEHRGMLDGYAVETEPVGGIAIQINDDPLHQRRRVDGLIPGTIYDIEVYSTMDGILSFKPSIIQISTPPAVPRGEVESQQITSESVFITWNPPLGQFDYYEIVYYPTDRDFGRLRERIWDARVNLTRLDPGSSYRVEIFSFSNDLVSKPLTATIYTRPLPPNKVKTTSTYDTIIMSWETVYFDGSARIEYTQEGKENETKVVFLEPGLTELSITNLEPGSEYVINVFTVKNGVESDPVTVTTLTSPPTKAPPSDNAPVSPKAAATENSISTETTDTTAQTNSAIEATTTAAAIAALVEETTSETIETTAAATSATTTAGKSTATERFQASTRTESNSATPVNSATGSTTQAAVVTTIATTASTTSTTTPLRNSATTEEQRSQATSADATGEIRSQKTTTADTTAAAVTNAFESATGPFNEKPALRQAGNTTEADTKQSPSTERTKTESTYQTGTTKPQSRTPPDTTPETTTSASSSTATTAPSTEFTEPTTRSASTSSTTPTKHSSTTKAATKSYSVTTDSEESVSVATIDATKSGETSGTTSEPEETYPPPFPDKENPGPPGEFKDPATTTSTTPETTSESTATTFNTNYSMSRDSYSAEAKTSRNQNKITDIRSSLKQSQTPYVPATPTNVNTGPPNIYFEKFAQQSPVVKVGEIYFPKTVAIGSTLASHFSLPNMLLGRTVKPFPRTQYYPWRATTDPRNYLRSSTERPRPAWATPTPIIITMSSTTKPKFSTTSYSTTTFHAFPTKPTQSQITPFIWRRRLNTWRSTTLQRSLPTTTQMSQRPTVNPVFTSRSSTKYSLSMRRITTRVVPTTPTTINTVNVLPHTWRSTTQSPITSSVSKRTTQYTRSSRSPAVFWRSTEYVPPLTTTTVYDRTKSLKPRITSPTSPAIYTLPNWLTAKTYIPSSTSRKSVTWRHTRFPYLSATSKTIPYKTTRGPINTSPTWGTTRYMVPTAWTPFTSSIHFSKKIRTTATAKTTDNINNWSRISTFTHPVSIVPRTTTQAQVGIKALRPQPTVEPISTTNPPFHRIHEPITVVATKPEEEAKSTATITWSTTSPPATFLISSTVQTTPDAGTTSSVDSNINPTSPFTGKLGNSPMTSTVKTTNLTIARKVAATVQNNTMANVVTTPAASKQNVIEYTPGALSVKNFSRVNDSSNGNESHENNSTTSISNTTNPSIIPEGRGIEITLIPETTDAVQTIPFTTSSEFNITTSTLVENSSSATTDHFVEPDAVSMESSRVFPTTESIINSVQDTTALSSRSNQNILNHNTVTPTSSAYSYSELTDAHRAGTTLQLEGQNANGNTSPTITTTFSSFAPSSPLPLLTELPKLNWNNMSTSNLSGMRTNPNSQIGSSTVASNATSSVLKRVVFTTANSTLPQSATSPNTYERLPPTSNPIQFSTMAYSVNVKPNATRQSSIDSDYSTITLELGKERITTQDMNEATALDTTDSKITELIRGRSKLYTLPPDDLVDDVTTSAASFVSQTTEETYSNVTLYVNTTEPVTEEEIIVEHDRETITIRNGFKTICKPNNMTVLVDKDVIGMYESKWGPLHFNKDDGQDCKGVEYENYYRYTIAPNILGCGTQFMVNETHVNFTNTVSNRIHHESWYADLLDTSGNILIGRASMKPFPLVHMNIYCTFPLEMTVHTDLIPDLRVEVKTFNVSGVGEFSAIMQLFKDDQYQHPHFAAPSLRQDELLRVGVTLLNIKDKDITVAVRKCWATPDRAFDYETYYPLIDEYCPIEGALNNNLEIVENAKSKRSRWEGPVFKFVKYDQVWLHCDLKICFGDSCNTTCDDDKIVENSRARRSLNRGNTIVSAGPVYSRKEIQIEKQVPEPPVNTSTQNDLQESTIIIIVAVLCAVIFLMCVTFVLIMVKCRRKSRDKETDAITHPESFASSTLGSRGGNDAYWDSDGLYQVRKSPVHNPSAPISVDPDLPPVPDVSADGNFPETIVVMEESSPPVINTNNCYPNPAFESKSEYR